MALRRLTVMVTRVRVWVGFWLGLVLGLAVGIGLVLASLQWNVNTVIYVASNF